MNITPEDLTGVFDEDVKLITEDIIVIFPTGLGVCSPDVFHFTRSNDSPKFDIIRFNNADNLARKYYEQKRYEYDCSISNKERFKIAREVALEISRDFPKCLSDLRTFFLFKLFRIIV